MRLDITSLIYSIMIGYLIWAHLKLYWMSSDLRCFPWLYIFISQKHLDLDITSWLLLFSLLMKTSWSLLLPLRWRHHIMLFDIWFCHHRNHHENLKVADSCTCMHIDPHDVLFFKVSRSFNSSCSSIPCF